MRRLSVVIPVRNGSETIAMQLRAIAGQCGDGESGPVLEVIVVDDASTDGTIDVVDAFEGRLPGLDVIGKAQAEGPAGSVGPRLYRKYRAEGMPRRSLPEALRFWGALLTHLPEARTRQGLARYVALVGYRLGILEGCIAARVVHL
jgi:glycosyltransferase involved in cell wall biosynthesis